jgi:hypothetical protein
MSNEKNKKNSSWGGARPKSGPKPGSGTKKKICLSVTEKTWDAAKKKWKKRPSWLVDALISYYIKTEAAI